MDQVLSKLQLAYSFYKQTAQQEILNFYPRLELYNRFELFIMLNLLIIAIFIVVTTLARLEIQKIYKGIVKIVFKFLRGYIDKQLVLARQKILQSYPKELLPTLDKIPYKAPDMNIKDECQKESLKGKLSGSRYCIENHCKFVANLSKEFSFANPLHQDMFPLVKQMENQVIEMTADAIGLKDQQGRACGTLNSGGTESIMMAIFAYREKRMKLDGVLKPNLVICSTGHIAAHKACDYLNVEIRIVPYDSNYQMHLGKMKSAIDQNTICVYTSYPNYPYGTNDAIQIIGPYCQKRGIPVHVDMCLGGFVVPFIQKDWKVPSGVTTISADPHKYGLSAKGVSILLYSSDEYRRHQYFVTCYWPGGLYGTPGLSGSRTGVYIASAWISMMKLGVKGYQENARMLKKTVVDMKSDLEKIGFEIYGNPTSCVISFVHKTHSISSIQGYMKKKGWGLALLQKPLAIHFSFTPLNCLKREQMLKDFQACIEELNKNPNSAAKDSDQIQLYCTCAKIPDNDTKDDILATILDTFIDLQ